MLIGRPGLGYILVIVALSGLSLFGAFTTARLSSQIDLDISAIVPSRLFLIPETKYLLELKMSNTSFCLNSNFPSLTKSHQKKMSIAYEGGSCAVAWMSSEVDYLR